MMATVAKHSHTAEPALRRTRLVALAVIWVAGLGVGFVGIVATSARYGCTESNTGLGCRGAGTVIGVLVIVGVIAIVTSVTAYTHERPPRSVVTAGVLALLGLGLLFMGAAGLLSTI